MKKKERPPITTTYGLLETLLVDIPSGRKTGAIAQILETGETHVREYFDSGHGHSSDFDSEDTPLDRKVFFGALVSGYIIGIQKREHVSQTEFKITDLGKQEFCRLLEEVRVAEKATPEVSS